MKNPRISTALLAVVVSALPCRAQDDNKKKTVAGNEQVAEIIRTFEGRGVQSDGSSPTPVAESLDAFQVRDGLTIELVASEPEISQPLFASWDSRGRMWIVQYRQYQYPAGLKVVRYDQHLRAVFDKTPLPPPHGDRGADVISVLTDTDGDGRYDSQKDVISGLNIATAVQVGRGGIWVLNPPYLLFYPDKDRDDIPDGPPEVHLSGFGLQDTHAVANSLLWGPDGWLYGANGSTTTGNISSEVTKNVAFQGQCIWRYHPRSKAFEIYAEGGGNTFSLEIDAKGRVFAGHNGGNTRGWYFPQGSYSQKNWGKHGPLTNPYAFGFFHSMAMEGDTRRFPQAFTIYEGGLMNDLLGGDIIAPNSLHNVVWHDELHADGSTYRTTPRPNLIQTSDRWFRPVHCAVGPDGCLYITDWFDTRLSHVSPIDDWHKESGRVYRVQPSDTSPNKSFLDLHAETSPELLTRFQDANKWVRKRASLELGWRNDSSITRDLVMLVDMGQDDRGSLEALWTLEMMGELTSDRAARWLSSDSPDIRRVVVKLLGDRHEPHQGLVQLAEHESNVHVRSQLASTAKRVDSEVGVPILNALMRHDEDADDPHLPLLIWWGVEFHADDFEHVGDLIDDASLWKHPIFADDIAPRLMQRYASGADQERLQRCAKLLAKAPNADVRNRLIEGLHRAFEGLTIPKLPQALQNAIENHDREIGNSDIVLRLRQGDATVVSDAIAILDNPSESLTLRSAIVKAIGDVRTLKMKPVLLKIASGRATSEPSLQRLALQSIGRYADPTIADALVSQFDGAIAASDGVREAACRTLASRPAWAKRFLQELLAWRIDPTDVPADALQQLRSHDDPNIQRMVDKVFGPETRPSTAEAKAGIERLREIVLAGKGDASMGQAVFSQHCGKCHQLFGEGLLVGPPLDGYERSKLDFWLLAIVDPNLEIREGYQSYVALTDDGRVINGMMSAQSQRTITLRDADNRTTILNRDELETFKALPTSLMPKGTTQPLSDQQVRDLFAYLMQPATSP